MQGKEILVQRLSFISLFMVMLFSPQDWLCSGREIKPFPITYGRNHATEHGRAPCVCANVSWCEPLTTPKPTRELFVYTLGEQEWKTSFNWSKITTVATYYFADPQLVCYAHERGIRVVYTVDADWTNALTPENRTMFAKSVAAQIRYLGVDGVNLDFEENYGTPMKSNYVTALYFELVDAVKADNPNAQTSICMGTFGWWGGPPTSYLPYDFAALALKSDFLLAMMYDMAIPNPGANSYYGAINATVNGLFTVASVPPEKVVFAFPWYGYEYDCNSTTEKNPNTGWCYVAKWPTLRSDQHIVEVVSGLNQEYSNVSAVTVEVADSYAWFTATRVAPAPVVYPLRTFCYDTPQTLSRKYSAAMDLGGKGLGVFTANYLGNSTIPALADARQKMWEAINRYY